MTDILTVLKTNFILKYDFFSQDFHHEHFLSQILAHSSDAILLLNEDFVCIACNHQFLNLLNYHSQNTSDEKVLSHISQSQTHFFSQLSNQLNYADNFNNISLTLSRDNKQIVVNASAFACQNSTNSKIYFIYLSYTDTNQNTITINPVQDGSLDPLTQLHTKDSFFEYAHIFVENIHKSDSDCIALIRLHIDKLHTFNASIGRNATDILIARFAERLQKFDMFQCEIFAIARLGGGDFAILLSTPNQCVLENYVNQLHGLSHQTFLIHQSHIYVNFSTGVAVYHADTGSFDRLLHHAERALKHALFLRGNTCVWFDKLEKSPIFSNVHLSSAFIHALRESQVIAYFQPKIARQKQYFTFEALVRWQHPILGLLSPKDFLDEVLDVSSQSLFENVVNYCLSQIDEWQQQGFWVKVAINIDVRQLWHQNFLPFIQSCMLAYPNFCEHIEFEITETAQIQHHDKTLQVLQQLHDFGIKLAIDDFGTGFASLSYLLEYPVDSIKLDRSFVKNICTNEHNFRLVKSIIDLAHELNLQVIAEGVETKGQLDLLNSINCDVTQGYLHGKPMSSEDISIWLKNMTL